MDLSVASIYVVAVASVLDMALLMFGANLLLPTPTTRLVIVKTIWRFAILYVQKYPCCRR